MRKQTELALVKERQYLYNPIILKALKLLQEDNQAVTSMGFGSMIYTDEDFFGCGEGWFPIIRPLQKA